MIKLIIFDLGGILNSEASDYIFKEMTKATQDPEFTQKYEKAHPVITKGMVTLTDFYSQYSNPFALVKRHLDLYKSLCSDKDPQIVSLISSLRERYSVIGLTNTEVEVAEYNRSSGLFDHFERVFLSTELKMMKPDSEIYHKTLEAYACKPEDAVFIDDRKPNVQGARAAGLNAIHYKNPQQLIQELEELF